MDAYQWIKVFALGGIATSGLMLFLLAWMRVTAVHPREINGLYAFPWGLCALSLGLTIPQLDSSVTQGIYVVTATCAGYFAFTRIMRAWRTGVWLPHDPVMRSLTRRIDRWAEGDDKPEAPKPQA